MCTITNVPPNKGVLVNVKTDWSRPCRTSTDDCREREARSRAKALDFASQREHAPSSYFTLLFWSWQDHVHQSRRAQFLQFLLNLCFSMASQRYAYISG